MPRNITVTFTDGSTHVYRNAPDNVTPEQVSARAQQDFGKRVKALDGGRGQAAQAPAPRQAPKPAAPQDKGWDFFSGDYSPSAIWQGIKSGMGDVVQAAGDTVGIVGNPLNATINAIAGTRLSTDLGATARKASGLPDNPSSVASAINKIGSGAMMLPGNALQGVASRMAMRPGEALAANTAKAARAVTAPRPSNPAAQVVQDGERAGVRVMTSDVKPPRTFIGKTAQAIGERIPITGTGGMRAAQQEQRIAAVKSVLEDHGAITAEGATDAVAADLAKTRGAMLERLTKAKNSVIQGLQGAVPVPQTVKAIDEQIARLSGINADAYAPVIAKLNEFKTQLASGKTLEQIEGNRKLLGDLFKDPSLAAIAGDGQKALNAIYGPLRSDMGNFIKTNGGQAAFNKWKGANDQLAAIAGELNNGTFKKVLADAESTPENVAKLLFSKKPSDVRRLYANLSAEGRAKAQAAVLHKFMNDAIPKAGTIDNISPDTFANQLSTLGRTAGVHFDPADLARLDGLSRVLNVTKRAAQSSVAPPTGVQAAPYAMGAGFTGLFGVTGGIGAAAMTGLLARAYESAPVRNALLRLGRAPKGSAIEATQLDRAAMAITAAIKPYADKIAAATNENTAPALAADPTAQQQQEQQPPLQP